MRIRKLVYSGLLIAIGVILPQLFHFSGVPDAGKVFLPMHISILLAGMLVGPVWGMGVGFITPIISSLITGMPAVPFLYFMVIELMVYAIVAGICTKKFKLNPYITLVISMIVGRAVYALALVVGVELLHIAKLPPVAGIWGGVITGLPGIAIQLVIIPPIVFALKRSGLALDRNSKSNS